MKTVKVIFADGELEVEDNKSETYPDFEGIWVTKCDGKTVVINMKQVQFIEEV